MFNKCSVFLRVSNNTVLLHSNNNCIVISMCIKVAKNIYDKQTSDTKTIVFLF